MVRWLVNFIDYPLVCKISTVKTLALRYNSGTSLTIVINDKNAIGLCCKNPLSNWKLNISVCFKLLQKLGHKCICLTLNRSRTSY